MADKRFPAQLVYGLDIGTRSVVGVVGYRTGKKFTVVALKSKEHDTRAMLDGQIHNISKVGETIREVTDELEKELGVKLKRACIAAAGRVLKTVQVHTDYELNEERVVTHEDIYTLNSLAIEDAYKKFLETNTDSQIKFYCVGSSAVRYYLNKTVLSSIEDHKAKSIGVDLIGTFLPDDVVDGLYKSIELAKLEVASLTLEPIAAIGLAIPEKFRLLNIALVDVGAGTSDISITKDGSIIAFGMLPTAGDRLTETIANELMVDFNTAEFIKREGSIEEKVFYEDIMGTRKSISKTKLSRMLKADIEDMATQTANRIIELNGNKSVGAVFVVGGGGVYPGYTTQLAKKLELQKERVAIRGKEVMNDIIFEDESIDPTSLLVTPIGIALSFYEETNNFIYVSFNDERVKIYNSANLTVMDVAMQTDFPSTGFFPKTGKALNYKVNGVVKMARGELGEPAIIKVNGEEANMHSSVKENDIIELTESTAGNRARVTIADLPGLKAYIKVNVNDSVVRLPKFASVNGELKSEYYEIEENDDIEILDYYTVEQIVQFMDITPVKDGVCMVNNKKADNSTKVYENFSVTWELSDGKTDDSEIDDTEENANEQNDSVEAELEENPAPQIKEIFVSVNGSAIKLDKKSSYVYVDIFDKIDFDLKNPQGNIVTKLNGSDANYMAELKDGDIIEVYWEKK